MPEELKKPSPHAGVFQELQGNGNLIETEVKFYLATESFDARLNQAERSVQARVYEINLRFDTPGGELTQAARVLRLVWIPGQD